MFPARVAAEARIAWMSAYRVIMRKKSEMICKVGAEYLRRVFNGLRRNRDCPGLDFFATCPEKRERMTTCR
jgi:hypothetical protein